jgi:uncharacterized protein (DUF924 family)
MPETVPQDVLEFWFGDGLTLGWPSDDRGKLWWGGGPELDAQIAAQYGPLVKDAVAGGLLQWEMPETSRLALVILLDQFTRNVFRGQPEAFAGDARAQCLVRQALDLQLDRKLPWVCRAFLYMPLMHAENATLQNECVRQFRQLRDDVPDKLRGHMDSNLKFAEEHRNIITRFGRFPHRNQVLARASTPEESEFLKTGPRYGQ